LLGAPAHDDTIAFFGCVLNYPPGNFEYRFAVDQIQLWRVDGAFVASAHKGFEKPVVQRVILFFAFLDYRLRAIREAGDLFRQPLVPEFPAETVRHRLSNFAAAASVFAFDGNDVDHAIQFSVRISDHV
jgi:hypothetical protein